MNTIKPLERLVLAIDPQTERPRVFYLSGVEEQGLCQPRADVYESFEGVSRKYTMQQLKTATYNRNLPVITYEMKDQLVQDPNQRVLFYDSVKDFGDPV